MPRYVVSYDLMKKKDYQSLWDALERAEARRVLLSVWTLSTSWTTREVFDWLHKYMDSDDRLVVFRYDDWVTIHAMNEPH